jgi:hypothetical protein
MTLVGHQYMHRRLTTLAAFTWVALVLAGGLASSALATPAHFKAGGPSESVYVQATEDPAAVTQTLETEFGEVECTMASAKGTASATAGVATLAELSLFGSAASGTSGVCHAFGEEAEVKANECKLRLHAGTYEGEGKATGSADLICPDGKDLEVATSSCTVLIPTQTGLGPLVYEPEGGKLVSLTATESFSGLRYVGEGESCSGIHEDGTLEGRLALSASEDEGGSEGKPVSLEAVEGKEEEATAHFKADGEAPATIKLKARQDASKSRPNQELTTTFGAIDCQTLQGEGTTTLSTSEAAYEGISYSGHFDEAGDCEALEEFATTVAFNGCHYAFHAGTTVTEGEALGTVDLLCPEGKSVEVKVGGGVCVLTIPAQEGLGPVRYRSVANEATGKEDLTAELRLEELDYQGDVFCSTELKHDGSLIGNVKLSAVTDDKAEEALNLTVAGAAHFQANSPTGNVLIHAEEDPSAPEQELFVDTGEMRCDIFTATGTASNTSSEVALDDVTYKGDYFEGGEECEAFGLESVVEFNGCEYKLHAGTIVSSGTSEGTVDLVCPEEQQVEIKVAGGLCTTDIPEQSGVNGITYHTVETEGIEEITVEVHATNIAYKETGLCGEGELTNNAEYNGKVTLKAFEDNEGEAGERVDVTIVEAETE